MARKFVIQKDDKSHCPQCLETVDLLIPIDILTRPYGPMFYICWKCKTVAQVGVGPVKRQGI